ncbi:hypothetical protein ACCQ12_19065 [Xanthomonas sp. NCPPB 1068]|uniref:hypothetical protein n=1 Tax=Xanthomonas sp. NCPPB 1068 TaxID=487525 RepID=UPI003557B333
MTVQHAACDAVIDRSGQIGNTARSAWRYRRGRKCLHSAWSDLERVVLHLNTTHRIAMLQMQ